MILVLVLLAFDLLRAELDEWTASTTNSFKGCPARRDQHCPGVISMRKKILIVNCFFDDSHRPIRRTWKTPQAMAPVYLAGAFAPRRCDIRLYDEVSSGPLEDERLLEWPDMLVLTGLTNSLDRMLHVTAYVRTKNPAAIVVAGGPPIRALPQFARRFFDYPCLGDIEEMRDVIEDAFGKAFVAETMLSRYDLAYWLGRFGYIETTRYCNFRCAFCALTGEGRKYLNYPLDRIRAQIMAMGKRKNLLLIDNNFYGNSKNDFLARVGLLQELHDRGELPPWAALVTNDFFYRDENLTIVRDAGCIALFSGVESFDDAWLRSVNKLQNTNLPQIALIRKTLDSGILFLYGLIIDLYKRRLADVRRELDFITATPEITLPAFVTLPIPILGSPYFHECLRKGAFLPNTKLRDMDGTTLVLRPLDPIEEAIDFMRGVVRLQGYGTRIVRHSFAFLRRYRTRLDTLQLAAGLANGALLYADRLATAPGSIGQLWQTMRKRTHVTTTEPPDEVYTPAFTVDSRYENYFNPTRLTDGDGTLVEALAEDLAQTRAAVAV